MQDSLRIKLFSNPDDAPNYSAPEFKGLVLDSAAIVGKGTVEGNPTVDLILVGEHGQKYVALVKGSFLEALGSAVTGKRRQGAN